MDVGGCKAESLNNHEMRSIDYKQAKSSTLCVHRDRNRRIMLLPDAAARHHTHNSDCVLIILHAIVIRPLTSHRYKAGTEHAGFLPDLGDGLLHKIWWEFAIVWRYVSWCLVIRTLFISLLELAFDFYTEFSM